ncbi:unnamed protein product [Eruca vesicaria subsp. sativa]|uniref:Uncharacterized protein n=1 Tax=Eruca vesicaria subsp. sativa TaxID=29727 RepID=A0ABC8M8J7_ERUVS|nr:unnamed protein product [Eruca vesicaria subsp. sativa]
MPSMFSVVEDSPVSNLVLRSDRHIPIEEQTPPAPGPESVVPGGSEQTREYYNDSSTRRRKSLDRSSSTRKLSASVIAEIDELKLPASNTKVSPKHSRSRSSSVRGDCSVENLEMGGRETVESSKKGMKKSKRWSWNIFGLLHRKNGNKYEEEEEGRRSGVDRTFSGSWNVESRNGFDPKMMRSNSSVSCRSSATGGGGGGFQRNSDDGGYISGKKKVSNSSSTSIGRKVENGVLKFNLTPSKGRRTGSRICCVTPSPADSISSLSFSPRADILVATSWDNQVRCWEISRSGTSLASAPKASISHDQPVLCSAWKDDGTTVFSGGCDKQAKMWPLLSGGQPVTVAMHNAPISAMAWIPGMNLLVTGSWDKTLRYWDTRQQTPVHTQQLPDKCYALSVKHPLMVGSIEGRVGVHHLDDAQQNKNFTFKCHRDGNEIYSVNALNFHPVQGTFATAGSDGAFNFWDKDSKQRLKAMSRCSQPIPCSSLSTK